ncbi:MAG TPA: hypothetical protein VMZ03_08985 [Chitinophagaceae bacterium]|nr:hypothetical protein [Chitinophagaceae bacterium]
MKYMLIFSLLLRIPAMAQEASAPACKLIRETDPYTKETKLSTGFIFFDGGSVTIDADSKEVIVLFSVEGPDRCFDNNSTADVFFEGIKSKTMSRNAGTMNCEGLFQFVFKNSLSTPTTLLQRILTKKTTQLIFNSNTKKPITVTVGPKEQEALMTLANCLVTEARTLIK